LAALTPGERQAIETTFFAGLTHVQAAARLNQPLGTIKPQVDNLRNFLLTPTAETLSFFQQLQEHLVR
jgi:DNA-directed RNA polymerase specialized sigma24 family protein